MSNNASQVASIGNSLLGGPSVFAPGVGIGLSMLGGMMGGKSGGTNTFDPKFRGGMNGSPLEVKLTTLGDYVPATAQMFGSNKSWRDNSRNIYSGGSNINMSDAINKLSEGTFKAQSYNSRLKDYMAQNQGVSVPAAVQAQATPYVQSTANLGGLLSQMANNGRL